MIRIFRCTHSIIVGFALNRKHCWLLSLLFYLLLLCFTWFFVLLFWRSKFILEHSLYARILTVRHTDCAQLRSVKSTSIFQPFNWPYVSQCRSSVLLLLLPVRYFMVFAAYIFCGEFRHCFWHESSELCQVYCVSILYRKTMDNTFARIDEWKCAKFSVPVKNIYVFIFIHLDLLRNQWKN